MTATHSVKINGKWYKAGDKLPAFSESVEAPETAELEEKTHTYTKTEINRMPVAELKALAAHMEIESSETMSGADLKRALIEKLVL